MDQLNLHTTTSGNPPPLRNATDLPILVKLNESYKLWHGFFNNLPRHTKFTLGTKIDSYFTDSIECCLRAGYAGRHEKLPLLIQLSATIDSLKFFLKLLWEIKALSTGKYTTLAEQLSEIGRMIGGWLQLLKKQLPQ